MLARRTAPPDALAQELADLEGLGVGWASLFLPGDTRAAFCDAVRRYGERLAKGR